MTRKPSPFNSNHIFVDTNVLVGGYSGDTRFQIDSNCLHYLYSLTGKKLYISTLSVAQLISVYQKKKTNEEIRRIVRELRHRFNVIDFAARDIDEALNETGADIEEDDGEHQSSVQYVLAMKQKCGIIVTNNYKDYRLLLNVRALRPERVRAIPQ
jgi:predicted nucleic acid-binding protein